MCPRSSDPMLYSNLLYKMGHYFLDIQYSAALARALDSVYLFTQNMYYNVKSGYLLVFFFLGVNKFFESYFANGIPIPSVPFFREQNFITNILV